MSKPHPNDAQTGAESTHREYVLNVRILECTRPDEVVYRFEAPRHEGVEFADPDLAELYADVYFGVNGFEEAGTGERGVPPTIIAAGRNTLAAYLLTLPYTDVNWVASFFGEKPARVQRYVGSVRTRAAEIRENVRERDLG
jgi:hypothetical protein